MSKPASPAFAPYVETEVPETPRAAALRDKGYKARLIVHGVRSCFVSRDMLGRRGWPMNQGLDVGEQPPAIVVKVDDRFAGIYHHVEALGPTTLVSNAAGKGSTRGDGEPVAIEIVAPPGTPLVCWWHPSSVTPYESEAQVAADDGGPCA